jgi:meiotically up-regulated gene 157 (Mug157) protein
LIWCAFRPSDDPTKRPFNIPQEMFATVALCELADLARVGYADRALATRALALSARVHAGIERYGRYYDFRFGWIYAYETDGRGDVRLMDDANIPILLAAPLYGYLVESSSIYANTRRFVLSRTNPYFFEGRAVSGIGSPHTPDRWVWPLAIATRAMTAGSRMEVAQQLAMLAAATETTGTVPESVNADDPSLFTRAEFGWANATYADLLFRTVSTFRALRAPPAMRWLDRSRTPMPALVGGLVALENDAAIVSALKRLFPTKPILSLITPVD